MTRGESLPRLSSGARNRTRTCTRGVMSSPRCRCAIRAFACHAGRIPRGLHLFACARRPTPDGWTCVPTPTPKGHVAQMRVGSAATTVGGSPSAQRKPCSTSLASLSLRTSPRSRACLLRLSRCGVGDRSPPGMPLPRSRRCHRSFPRMSAGTASVAWQLPRLPEEARRGRGGAAPAQRWRLPRQVGMHVPGKEGERMAETFRRITP